MAEIVVEVIKWLNPHKITQSQNSDFQIKLRSNEGFKLYKPLSVWENINTYFVGTIIGMAIFALGYFIEILEIAMFPGFFLSFIYGFLTLIQLPRVWVKRSKETKYYRDMKMAILNSKSYEEFCEGFYGKHPPSPNRVS